MIKNKKKLVIAVLIIFLITVIALIIAFVGKDKSSGNASNNLKEVYLDEIEEEDGLTEVENEDADINSDENSDNEDKVVEQGLSFIPSEPNLDEDSENNEKSENNEENEDDSLEEDTGKFGRFF